MKDFDHYKHDSNLFCYIHSSELVKSHKAQHFLKKN